MPEPQSPYKRVRRRFSQQDLKRVCEMHESEFGDAYEMDTYVIKDVPEGDNFFYFKNNESNILAVAHLDTVMPHERRTANFVNTAAGPVVYSGALDDRLGAYTILELMPKLGLNFDILLTVGEEKGASTAQYFDSADVHDRQYNWMIEFDRGGTDCVMYQYEDLDLRNRVKDSGATPAHGIFSDISYLDHLEIKGVNWGVGYRDYHGPRSHAYLEDYWTMIGHFLNFHAQNADEYLPHENVQRYPAYGGIFSGGQGRGTTSVWDDEWRGFGDDNDYIMGRSIRDSLDEGTIRADLEDLGLSNDEIDELIKEADALEIDDDDIVSDDFNTVNRALTVPRKSVRGL
jgi:hypothetical protein